MSLPGDNDPHRLLTRPHDWVEHDQPDRLAEIKGHRHLVYGDNVDPLHFTEIRIGDLDWLVAEVERLRRELDGCVGYMADIDQHADKRKAAILLGAAREKEAENDRLRGLLRRLEWTGNESDDMGNVWLVCPWCREPQAAGHTATCKLAAELGR